MNGLPIILLIQEKSGLLTVFHIHLVLHTIFLNLHQRIKLFPQKSFHTLHAFLFPDFGITSLVDSKLENAKYSHLEDEKDDIIEDAMDIYDTNRRIHQDSAVNAAFDMRMDIDDIKKQLADDFDDEDFDYDDLDEED